MPQETAPVITIEDCIRECERCRTVCLRTALTHCLEEGGRHVEPGHFRLMLDCARICNTAAEFMLGGSRFHGQVCGVCALVCEACAESCERIGGMTDCSGACRVCAEHCRQMAGSATV